MVRKIGNKYAYASDGWRANCMFKPIIDCHRDSAELDLMSLAEFYEA
jgi:hypothetical protein